jgi:hypothetical protein
MNFHALCKGLKTAVECTEMSKEARAEALRIIDNLDWSSGLAEYDADNANQFLRQINLGNPLSDIMNMFRHSETDLTDFWKTTLYGLQVAYIIHLKSLSKAKDEPAQP